MPPPLADRIALVTGASRGIGRATAVALARAGAHVVAVARTVGGLEELDDAIRAADSSATLVTHHLTARQAGSSATLLPPDLKDHEGIARLGAALAERYQRLAMLTGDAAFLAPLPPL